MPAKDSFMLDPKALENFYQDDLEDIAAEQEVDVTTDDDYSNFETSCSSGLLRLDLRLNNGGWTPGFISVSGKEGGGKTTLITQTIHEALANGMAVAYYDYESSFQYSYAEMFSRASVPGKQLKKRIKIYRPDTGDQFFEMLEQHLLHKVPVKKKMDGQWTLIFDKEVAEHWQKKKRIDFKSKELKRYYKNKKFYLPTTTGMPQMLVIVDSLAAMWPDARRDGESKQQARTATMFRDGFPKIKVQIGKTQCVVLGINQVREKPMASKYENPEYEPGGNALAHACDVRVRVTGCSVPQDQKNWSEDEVKGGIYTEYAWNGSKDIYKFSKIEINKNKKGSSRIDPFWTRLCVEPGADGGTGMGFCVPHDLMFFCKDLGMLESHRGGKFRIVIDGDKVFNTEPIDLTTFKWILQCPDKDLVRKLCDKNGINPERARGSKGIDAYLRKLAKSEESVKMFRKVKSQQASENFGGSVIPDDDEDDDE